MPRVSVIVVTYNSEATIARCLGSIPSDSEVIVVDNASADGTREAVRGFQNVRLIENSGNAGFGAANNIGLAEASGTYALLLNPDASAEPGAIDCLADFMDATPDAVACGGRLTHPDGRLQESASTELTLWKVFLEQSLLDTVFPSPYWVSSRHTGKPMRVAQVMGACLMMRRVVSSDSSDSLDSSERVINHHEGSGKAGWKPPPQFMTFDERFFLVWEDVDLALSIARTGHVALAVPNALN